MPIDPSTKKNRADISELDSYLVYESIRPNEYANCGK